MRISSLIQSFLNTIEIDIRRTCLYSRYNFVRNVHTSSQISCTIYACASSWALVIGEVCLLLELFFLVILEQLLRSIFILRSSEDWSIRNKDTFVMREPNWTSTERASNGTFVRKVASVILNPIDNETPCAPINIKQERLWTFFSRLTVLFSDCLNYSKVNH